MPLIGLLIGDNGGKGWILLMEEADRICFMRQTIALRILDFKLISLSCTEVWNKQNPVT